MRGELNQFANFAAGLNSQNATYLLDEGQCRDCLNVNTTVRGAIQQRGGSLSLATHSATINSLFPFEAFVGSATAVKYLIAATDDGQIRAINSAGTVGASIASGLTASTQWDFAQFPGIAAPGSPGYLFAVNGSNEPRYWTGVTQTTQTQTWSNINTGTLSAAYVSANPSVLRFASLPAGFGFDSILTWPINGANAASPAGGMKVIAIDTSQGDARVTVTDTNGAPLSQSVQSGTTITATNPASIPSGRLITQWSQRLWMAGTGVLGARLYYSNVADAFSWSDVNTLDLDVADGEIITGLKVSGPYLLVFKESKVYAIYDFDPELGPLYRTISANIGACSHRAIVETPRGTFFLSADKGVWKTDGTSISLVSKDVGPSFALLAANRSRASAAYFNDHVYFTFASSASSGANDVTMDYDTQVESWWKHDNAVRDLAVWRSSSSAAAKLYGVRVATRNAVSAGVDQLFVEGLKTDIGLPFTTRWVSAWHQMKTPALRKRIRRVVFDGTGTVQASISLDFAPTWIQYASFAATGDVAYTFGDAAAPNFGSDPAPFGGGNTSTTAAIYGVGGSVDAGRRAVGRAISVRFESTSTNGLGVNSYTIAFTRRKN